MKKTLEEWFSVLSIYSFCRYEGLVHDSYNAFSEMENNENWTEKSMNTRISKIRRIRKDYNIQEIWNYINSRLENSNRLHTEHIYHIKKWLDNNK